MEQNATAARRVGDDRTADYWTEQVEAASLAEWRREHQAEWDSLKGSPDHG